MHLQLSKEWRLLRPAFVAAIGLATVPALIPVTDETRSTLSIVPALCLFFAGVLLGIEIFGREFHQQTLTLWLALPRSRTELWRPKLTVTAIAVAVAILVHWVTLLTGAPLRGFLPDAIELVGPLLGVVGGAALGLFWSVQLRQTWAALWMSLIVPGLLMLAIQLGVALFWPMPDNLETATRPKVGAMFAVGFCLIGALALVRARQRFDRLEDLGPVGEDVQLRLPRFVRAWGWTRAGKSVRKKTATASLWWKEIRLQQVNLALAAGFAILMLCVQIARHMALSMTERFSPPDLEPLDFLWALWSLLPLTIGLASTAEERRLGVDAWQETLPVSRARRWWIKIGAAYALAFGMGVVVPVMGERLIRSDPFGGMLMFHGLAWVSMTTAGIYVSSLARNLVHAISILVPFAVGLALASACGLWLARPLGAGPDRYAAIPVELHFQVMLGVFLLVALLWLCWRNGNPNAGEGPAWRFNAATIFVAWLAAVLSVAGTRTRAWELLRPEAKAMPALATVPGVQPDVVANWTHLAVLTPDGSLWSYRSAGRPNAPKQLRRLGVGQTWISMGAGEYAVHAIRSDGTLWRWGQELAPDPERPDRWTRRGKVESSWTTPTQVGTDSDWRVISGTTTHNVALKTDGSLWGWGSSFDGQLGRSDRQYVPAPIQIGTATHWTCVAAGQTLTLAANRDGEVWIWGEGRGRRNLGGVALEFGAPRRLAAGPPWKKLFRSGEMLLGLTQEDEIWLLKGYGWLSRQQGIVRWEGTRGGDMMLDAYETWAIGVDGRLLRWHLAGWNHNLRIGLPPAEEFHQVGRRSDWIALDTSYGLMSCVGLTSDGGLWTWGVPFGVHEVRWLPPSQRPRQIALLRPGSP